MSLKLPQSTFEILGDLRIDTVFTGKTPNQVLIMRGETKKLNFIKSGNH